MSVSSLHVGTRTRPNPVRPVPTEEQLLAAAAALRSSARAAAIADVLERAAREGADIGDLIASACRQAAARLAQASEGLFFDGDGRVALTARRSQSWEAEHVRALTEGWENER